MEFKRRGETTSRSFHVKGAKVYDMYDELNGKSKRIPRFIHIFIIDNIKSVPDFSLRFEAILEEIRTVGST
jgi:hypothetical protein